jgi:hypothetical protein
VEVEQKSKILPCDLNEKGTLCVHNEFLVRGPGAAEQIGGAPPAAGQEDKPCFRRQFSPHGRMPT